MQFESVLTNYIVPITTVFSNVMVGLVPIVVGWMRYFSTNIKVLGQTNGYDKFYGQSYSLKLENKTLRSFVIDKINVFINPKNFFTINLEKLGFEKRTLEPFKQLVIQEQWTEIANHELNRLMMLSGIKFELICSNKIILIHYLSIKQKIKRHKLFFKYFYNKNLMKMNNQFGLIKNSYGDKIISKSVKFALNLYKEDGGLHKTILICESGFMNDCIFLNIPGEGNVGCNQLPIFSVQSIDILINYLKNDLFRTSQQKFMVEEIKYP